MKPDKHFPATAGIFAAACLIGLTWVGTIHAQPIGHLTGVITTLSNQVAVLDRVSRDVVLTDKAVRLSSGSAAIGGMRRWHPNTVRALHSAGRSLSDGIDTDYRIASLADLSRQTGPGAVAFVHLAELQDARLRIDPHANVSDTEMFAAVTRADSGIRAAPTINDAVRRVEAFRHMPGRSLAVMVALSEDEATRPPVIWRQKATVFIACIAALLAGLVLLLIRGMTWARRREALMAQDRVVLAGSNARLEVARALAAAKAERLEATLGGMSDGISMVDSDLCLVEWNARFSEIAGVPPEILRVGLPMEDILRAQVRTGQFGWVQDPEAEVERRMARLRVAPFGVVQRPRPDGRIMELRRNRLPNGGFVTLYSDITERKQVEQALRTAQAEAETANAEKSRFVAIVSHEIRTPLNALLNTVRLLSDSDLAPAQRSLLAMAHQSGDVLFGLINDILDMSQMEAGKLSIRPSLFELRPLLESCVEMFTGQAAQRGITMRVAIAEGAPPMLLTDPGRLRQIQLNLLSNAVKYARPGDVWVIAEPGLDGQEAVRLSVRDDGPAIAAEARQGLFRPFLRLDRPGGDDAVGTGLGLSICHHLITLMGGKIGCDRWSSSEPGPGDPLESGARTQLAEPGLREGNVFWVTLPLSALPPVTSNDADLMGEAVTSATDRAVRLTASLHRRLPRTRILLVEDVEANQIITAVLLRREGHHIDVVASGAAAVEAVQATPYDLVFMDIFMPGMSGQEATQIIRALAEPACSVPIIALTANVSPQDEAIFKAAGMNGLLAKPVSLAGLLDVLRRYVWETGSDSAGLASDRNPQSSDLDASAVLSMDRIAELRSNLPPAIFHSIMEECLVDMDHRFPELRQALAEHALNAITAHAHAMVGMAAGYGMAALESRLRAVLNAARDGDLSALGPSVADDLELALQQAARSLREILRAETV